MLQYELKECALRENAATRLTEVSIRCRQLQNENARLRGHIGMLERRAARSENNHDGSCSSETTEEPYEGVFG